ncbi:MAG TPA: HU family DNA-binding protein [Ignavibacteria bacterium]|nr:HU family DNA-binding protein [Ignavibacteria bacterium]HMR41172.1 HU family DNA-binding protein [Ignavibacteria bacterium]
MTKEELITKIAGDAKITKVQAKAALGAVVESVMKTLKKGGKLSLVGFGTFSISKRKARTGRNPQTGKAIQIKAKKVAKFKAGKQLSEFVNK